MSQHNATDMFVKKNMYHRICHPVVIHRSVAQETTSDQGYNKDNGPRTKRCKHGHMGGKL